VEPLPAAGRGRGGLKNLKGDLAIRPIFYQLDGGDWAESVLRCALLKQQRQLSYEELAFHRGFGLVSRLARLPWRGRQKKSVYCTRRSARFGRDLGGGQPAC